MDRKRRFKETDKGKEFIESGMTLITEPESDKYLNNGKHQNFEEENKRQQSN